MSLLCNKQRLPEMTSFNYMVKLTKHFDLNYLQRVYLKQLPIYNTVSIFLKLYFYWFARLSVDDL